MTRLDDRIRDGLHEAGPAAAPDLGALTDEITRRRHHRDTVRRVQMGGLTVVVLAATVVGYMALSRAFTGSDDRVPANTDFGSSGMVVSCATEVPGLHLCRVPVDAVQGGVASSDVVPLTEQPGEAVMNPSVSPDGRTIVFDRVESDGSFALWRIGIDGTDERLLLEDVADGSWSLDGDWIVAVADGDGDHVPETLVVIGPDGDLGSSVSGYLDVIAAPSYAPDSDTIVVTGEDGDRRGIFTISGEGRPRLLPGSDGASSFPIWVDADAVLYVAHTDEGDSFKIQALDGTTRDAFPVGLQPVYRPSLSPDGTTIAFETVSTSDEPAVATIAVGGGDPAIVLPSAAFPAWVPAAAPTSPSTPPVVEGEDIGVGTNVCRAERLGGLDILPGGGREAAWTGYLVKEDGTCPDRNPTSQTWMVAIDAGGDGVADTWTVFPSGNCPYVGCFPLGATDLNADGDGELIITSGFSIQDQTYFAIETGEGGASIAPIFVASPGHPQAGITGGAPLVTSSGGDEGSAAWIRCEGYPGSPVLVFTSVSSVVDSEQPADWHEVKLRLEADGMFHVVDATDLSLPPGDDPGLIRSHAPACGVDFTGF